MNEQQAAPARSPRTSGFTLMEMMIVMVLIVILAGIGLSVYGNSVQRAKEATLKEDLFRMRDAIDQYYADKGAWPPDLASLVSSGYMRQIPRDPFTESAETWQPHMSESDPANPSATPGVDDVKSGSTGTMLDGRTHAEL